MIEPVLSTTTPSQLPQGVQIGAIAEPADVVLLPDLVAGDSDGIAELPAFGSLEHPVAAYLSSIAESSRRVQRSALDWIARRATDVYTVETMPWHRIRRPHVLRIRRLLQDAYAPATANSMLSSLRGVLKECWHARLMPADDYQSAVDVPTVRGESEMRGRDLSPGELRALMEPAPGPRASSTTSRTPVCAGAGTPLSSPSTSPTWTSPSATCSAITGCLGRCCSAAPRLGT